MATSCNDYISASRVICNRWLGVQTNRSIEVIEGSADVELRVDGVRYMRVNPASDASLSDASAD